MQVRVGAYYLRYVLAADFDVEILDERSATRFLGQLYHAFLTADVVDVQVRCLVEYGVRMCVYVCTYVYISISMCLSGWMNK